MYWKKPMDWMRSFPQGVPLTLLNILLMSLGFYALIPYLSYYLTHSLGWTAFLAGVLLMTRQFSQQGLTFLTGMVGDRVGYKRLMVLGMLVRGIGFAMFGLFDHPAGLLAAAAVSGLGGAMFEPTRDAALTALADPADLSRVYAARKVFAQAGLALSAPLSAMLINLDFRLLSYACGLLFFGAALLTQIRMPEVTVQSQPLPFVSMWRIVLRDRTFLLFVAVMCGHYFMSMQSFLTIPMQVVAITGDVRAVSLVNLVMATLILCLQVPVNRRLQKFELLTQMRIGLGFTACGLVVLGLASGMGLFLTGFLLFSIGTMIMEPAGSEMTARLADKEVYGTYFGFASVAMAVGGGLSQGAGGWLFQTGADQGIPMLVFLCGGVAGGLAIWGLNGLRGQAPSRVLFRFGKNTKF
ncbi:MFS transporter [Tumebacillus flagellatus]|uniref:Major facilitator superfamily (MFS) profile domain-containing protein n=1 Tax=Tumebacillus flagellatus TaxID=1157490 RepID=A0A074LX51_9BACL|nr:MFS transporter [Tumebacillus flagellatus]KEO84618.1 hypothetical protein EL26_03625 [Tumebacillus flagellatus]